MQVKQRQRQKHRQADVKRGCGSGGLGRPTDKNCESIFRDEDEDAAWSWMEGGWMSRWKGRRARLCVRACVCCFQPTGQSANIEQRVAWHFMRLPERPLPQGGAPGASKYAEVKISDFSLQNAPEQKRQIGRDDDGLGLNGRGF